MKLRILLDDEPLIWRFLMIAAHEATPETVKNNPDLARYASNWGRVGDSGFVAEANGVVVGAAWLRFWPGEDKGFGWISDQVPELAMAVSPQWQGQGIGTMLLKAVIEAARGVHPAISLNVRADNAAVRLYERCGFAMMPNSERVNRTGGVSFSMLRAELNRMAKPRCDFSQRAWLRKDGRRRGRLIVR